VTALLIINAACFGAVVLGVHTLGRLYFSPAAAWWAAALLAIHPLFLFFVSDFWDTYVALAIFVWALVAAARGVGPTGASVLGAALGMLSLTDASYLFAYPLIVWQASGSSPINLRRRSIALAVLFFCLTLTPWTLRNAMVFHRLMYVRGGAALELWQGNRPGATGLLNNPTLALHPYKNGRQRALLKQIGETEYFRRCRQMFIQNLKADPWNFARMCAIRAGYILIGNPKVPQRAIPPFLFGALWHGVMVDKVAMGALTSLSGLLGICLAWRRAKKSLWIAGAGALAVLPFVLTSITDRYLLPLWAVFLLFGGHLISTVIQRFQKLNAP
jgi:hypothetical protein